MKNLSFCFMLFVALTHFINPAKAQSSVCQEHLRIIPNRDFYIPYVQCNPLEFEQLPLGNTFFGPVCNANNISLDNPHGFFFWTDFQAINMLITHNFGPPFSAQIFIYGPIEDCIDNNNYFKNSCTYQRQLGIPGSNNTEYVSINVGQPGLYIIVIDGTNDAYGDCKIEMIELDNKPGGLDKTLSSSVSSGGGSGAVNITLTAAFSRDSDFIPHPKLTQMFNDCTFVCDNCPVGPGNGCNPFDPISIIEISHPPSWVVEYSASLDSEEFYVNITECHESGELCVKYQYDNCVDSICVFLEVAFDTLYKCPNETVLYKGNSFSDPGDYVVQEGFLFNNVNIINYPGGNRTEEYVELCTGSSYQGPDGQIYTEDAEIVEIINTNNPCPDTMVTVIRFVNPDFIFNWTQLDTLICEGNMAIFHFGGPAQMSEIQVNGQTIIIQDNFWTSPPLTENTCFNVLFVSEDGLCSSVESICVGVLPQIQMNLGELHFCSGDSIMVGESYYNQGGEYQAEITSADGCDTTLFFSLIEIAADTTFLFDTICTGNAYSLHGYVYHDPGTYLILLENQFGCDSLLILNLEVQESDTIFTTIHLCPANNYTIRGQDVSTLPWSITFDSTDISGCIMTIVEHYEAELVDNYIPEIKNPCEGESNGTIKLSGSGVMDNNFYQWSPGVSESNVAENLASGLYGLTITDEKGCMQSFSWTLVENQMQEIEFNVVHESCPGLENGSIEVIGNDISEIHLNGIKADITLFESLSPGRYDLEFTNVEGCKSNQTIDIISGSEVSLDLPDTIYISRAEIGSMKQVPVVWFDEDQIGEINWHSAQALDCESCLYPSIRVNELDYLRLQVKSKSGCIRNFESVLFPELKQHQFLPQAFSPNGDGINDTWNIYGLQKFSSFHVRIYNRWGVKISDRMVTESSTSLWDGYDGKEICPPGPYIYQIEWLDQEGKKGKFFGSVELMR